MISISGVKTMISTYIIVLHYIMAYRDSCFLLQLRHIEGNVMSKHPIKLGCVE